MTADHRRALAALCVCVLAAAVLAVPVGAGDSVSVYDFDPGEVAAEPGEELEIELVLSSHGGYAGDGVVDLAATVEYDADAVSVTDVEAGTWLAGEDAAAAGDDADVETTVETESGSVTIEQERVADDDGTVGTATVATLTVAVAEDAEPGETTLELADTEANTAAYPQQTIDRTATIDVAGEADSTLDAVSGFGSAAALAALLSLAIAARTAASRR